MKLLVCGATGYVGKHIIRQARACGHKVLGLARTQTGAESVRAEGAESVVGNLEDVSSILPLLDRVDAVISAAQLMLEEERAVAKVMLDHMEGTDKTFIFTSGTALLSQKTDGYWSEDTFAEDDPFVPSKYVGARFETENMVRAYKDRGIRSIVIRPPLIWGNGECKVIQDLYTSAAKTGAVCFVGPGLNVYSSVHIEDLMRVFMLALEKGTAGALYHAVSGEQNYRSIADTVARTLGVSTRSITFSEAVEIWDKFTALIGFSICCRTRSPRTHRELGWTPSRDKLDILVEAANPAFKQRMTASFRPSTAARQPHTI